MGYYKYGVWQDGEEAEPKYGDIDFTGKDIGIPAVPFDKIATSGRGELLLLSIFTDQMRVKAIRSILCGGAKAVANASGVKLGRPGCMPYERHTPGRLMPTSDGYNVYTHKIGYGMAHALFVTRMQGFMKVITPESLWQELNTVRFTTPILREWIPYVEKTLRENERLENAHTFNCECGVLSVSTKALDEVVSEGLKRREIIIPRPTRAA